MVVVSLDLLADGLDRGMGAQKTIGQRLVFTEKSEKQVLSLDCRGTRTGWLRTARKK